MFNSSEIAAGAIRLGPGQRLKPRDVRTLVSLFRIYLKDRAAAFSDMKTRLEAVANASNDEAASELGALVNAFEEKGFSLAELSGGRNGLQTDKKGELVLKIQYGLTLLDYYLPEYFSGNLETGDIGGAGSSSYCSFTPKKDDESCIVVIN